MKTISSFFILGYKISALKNFEKFCAILENGCVENGKNEREG